MPAAFLARPARRRTAPSPARIVSQLVVAALAALLLVALAFTFVLRQYALDESVRDARNVTLAEGRTAIAPLLADDLLTGSPATLARLDAAVRATVLDDRLVRVKIWDET